MPTIVSGHNCGLHMHAGCAAPLPALTVPYSTVKCDVRVLSVAAYQIAVIAREVSSPFCLLSVPSTLAFAINFTRLTKHAHSNHVLPIQIDLKLNDSIGGSTCQFHADCKLNDLIVVYLK